MCLVLGAVAELEAVIVSDGNQTRISRRGELSQCSTETPKFKVLAPDLALAAVGSGTFVSMYVHPSLEAEVQARQADGDIFNALTGFLARNLPVWDELCTAKMRAAGFDDTPELTALGLGMHGAHLVLIGANRETGRMRCVKFGRYDGYEPHDKSPGVGQTVSVALGVGAVDALGMLQKAFALDELLVPVPALMIAIIECMSRQHRFISPRTFVHELRVVPQ